MLSLRLSRVLGSLLLAAALAAQSSCSAGFSIGTPIGSTDYTDFFLLGEDIYDYHGPDAGDPDIDRAVEILMDRRALYMGLFERGGSFPNAVTTIRDSQLSSPRLYDNGFDFQHLYALRGYGDQQLFGSSSDVLLYVQSSSSLLPGFSELQLSGRYDVFDAQRLIDDVSFFRFSDGSSASTTPIDWILSGYNYGRYFEVHFTQDLRAIADSYRISSQ